MKGSLRLSLGWLHTWAGIVFGGVLFAIFWTGTLSVFDREIDQWMMPGLRVPAAVRGTALSLDRTLTPAAAEVAKGAAPWDAFLPDGRNPAFRLFYETADHEVVAAYVLPTGGTLDAPGSLGGSGFFFPFHFSLMIKWKAMGYWIVGLCGMAMLVLLVSGVVIHRKIFSEFFTFRPKTAFRRSSLDLHNLCGVLALPFHFVVTFSGLAIFIYVYFPQAPSLAFADAPNARAAYFQEAFGRFQRPRSPLTDTFALASLDEMAAQAQHLWRGDRVGYVRVWHPGNANSYVEMARSSEDEIRMNLDQVYFDAATGAVLKRFEAAPVMSAQRFLSGLHFIQFDHWVLRWLYFAGGLCGCVLIATGMLFWVDSRRPPRRQDPADVRLVEALAIASITGIVLATLGYFIANRVLPAGTSLGSQQRAALEVWVFFMTWLAALLHAAWRMRRAGSPSRRVWLEQTWALSAMAALCAILNAVTTGDHLVRTYASGRPAVAGMDTLLVLTCVCGIWVVRRLSRTTVPRTAALRSERPT